MLGANISNICYEHRIPGCKSCFGSLGEPMGLVDHFDRLVRVEAHINRQIDENRKVSRRMDAMEETIRLHATAIAYKEKRPYKCPNCDGSGRYKLATATGVSDIIDCHSCKEQGIVWG